MPLNRFSPPLSAPRGFSAKHGASAAGAVAGVLVGSGLALACEPARDRCGPASGTVARVIDGDTIELESGERVRYLLIDTPETDVKSPDCWADEARALNQDLVLGNEVTLAYDEVCEDAYGRLLAYVSLGKSEINRVLVERGFACVLHIPPNGDALVQDYQALESAARQANKGMWGACDEVTCDD